MDVLSIASTYTAMKQSQLQLAVETSLLRKGLDIQAQAAADLLQALPQQTVLNPSYLGRNIDIKI